LIIGPPGVVRVSGRRRCDRGAASVIASLRIEMKQLQQAGGCEDDFVEGAAIAVKFLI
jgi:hypothetical protein